MRSFSIALLLAVGCGGSTTSREEPDLGPIICTADIDNYDDRPICTVPGQQCVTATGAYPYGAECRGCAPGPYHWYDDDVGIVCPDGGTD